MSPSPVMPAVKLAWRDTDRAYSRTGTAENRLAARKPLRQLMAVLPFAVGHQLVVVDVHGNSASLMERAWPLHLQNRAEHPQLLAGHCPDALGQGVGVLQGDAVRGQKVPPRVADLHFPDDGTAQIVQPQSRFCLFQLILRGGQIKPDGTSGGGQREGKGGEVGLFLRLHCLPALHIPLFRMDAAQQLPLFRADLGVIQIGFDVLGKNEFAGDGGGIHQETAQILVRFDAGEQLIAVQAARHAQRIIQASGVFRRQGTGENLLGLQIHGIHQPGQLVQLPDAFFAEQGVALKVSGKGLRSPFAAYDLRGGPAAELLHSDHLVSDLIRFRGEADVCHILAERTLCNVKHHYASPPISCWCCSAGLSRINSSSVTLPW